MQSSLTLSTQRDTSGRTQLKDLFVTPPFKVMALPHQGSALEAIQMSASPGLLAGDSLVMEVNLAPHTELLLRTQAYTRVQAMNEGQWAEQHSHILLQQGSCFYYLPHPLVLHQDSALRQTMTVEMEPDSQFVYGEIVAIGRVLNNERFAFREFASYLRIEHQGIPLLSDRIRWVPQQIPLTALSQMEDYSHQGTFVLIDWRASGQALREFVEQLQTRYAEYKDVVLGVSLLDKGGFIVRATAYRADVIEKLFAELQRCVKQRER